MKTVSILVTNHPGFLTAGEIAAGKYGVFVSDATPEEACGDRECSLGTFDSEASADDFAAMLHRAMPNVSVLVVL